MGCIQRSDPSIAPGKPEVISKPKVRKGESG